MSGDGMISIDELFGCIDDILCTSVNEGIPYNDSSTIILVFVYCVAGMMGKKFLNFVTDCLVWLS